MVHAIFLHPDLGIGGAERLVVDAGLALQEKGHKVSFVTNHHDPSHCFIETRDGTFPVSVVGDWLPRTVFGYFHALCAYLRMLYLTMYLLMVIAPVDRPDVLICDQIPIGLPLIKLFRFKTIFYCHFPDLLLSKPGGSLKKVYRQPLNWLEETTMSFADRILVNSRFTARVFKNTFKSIKIVPTVLYPSINTKAFDHNEKHLLNITIPDIPEDSFVFLSINRYERKKNLGLAVHAMQALETILRDEEWNKVHLVIAGGYDTRVTENVEYYDELVELCEKQNLTSKVTFMKSPSDHMKLSLLARCGCVLYTPDHEHFGIVPLEAMYSSKPVIAVKSGGPTETIVHENTGYLTEPIPENMAHYMAKLIGHDELRERLGASGKRRFMEKFSFQTFSRYLNSIVFSVTSEGY